VPVLILKGMGTEIPERLRALARFQAGVVSKEQAVQAGMSRRAVDSKVASRRWNQIYRGVYATFTGPVSRKARLWAAVLYAGPQARLSHETAAELLGLPIQGSSPIHVTIAEARRVRPPDGVVIHRSSHMGKPWKPVGFPPHTFVEETIIDLVQSATDLDDVIALVTLAFGKRLTSAAHLKREAARRKKLRWRDDLDEIIAAAAGGAHSLLEYRYDRDVERAHGLPAAKRQVPFTKPDGTRGFRDRCYDKFGLVVELDGQRFHDGRREQDRRRDNDAVATTGATLRYTWDDVTRRPCATAAQVHAALRSRGYLGDFRPCGARCRAVTARAAS
jgi:hypothetical protein